MRRKNTTKQMMKAYMTESLFILLREKSYEDISISEIAEKAGVNRSTYYRNFTSKDEIVISFYENIMRQYLSAYKSQSRQTLEKYLLTMFQCFYEYKAPLLLLCQKGLSHLLLKVLNSFFERQVLVKYPAREHFKIFFHIGGIYNFFMLWFLHDMRETPEELVKTALSIMPPDTRPMLAADDFQSPGNQRR